jgi:hypothetical protein
MPRAVLHDCLDVYGSQARQSNIRPIWLREPVMKADCCPAVLGTSFRVSGHERPTAPPSQESASDGEKQKRALHFFALEFREARPMVAA